MSSYFKAEYSARLPWPLAQLYPRAHNEKSAHAQHGVIFNLFEVFVRLPACALIAAYLAEVEKDPQVAKPDLDAALASLHKPSFGAWNGLLRDFARHYGEESKTVPALGHLWPQLTRQRKDLPAVLELYRNIKNGIHGQPAGSQSVSVRQLLDTLVEYRNAVIGHGSTQPEKFYSGRMCPRLFPALNELLGDGTLDLLGPSGTRLLYVDEIRIKSRGTAALEVRELTGSHGLRQEISIGSRHVDALESGTVAVLWPGQESPLPLNPLARFL